MNECVHSASYWCVIRIFTIPAPLEEFYMADMMLLPWPNGLQTNYLVAPHLPQGILAFLHCLSIVWKNCVGK